MEWKPDKAWEAHFKAGQKIEDLVATMWERVWFLEDKQRQGYADIYRQLADGTYIIVRI